MRTTTIFISCVISLCTLTTYADDPTPLTNAKTHINQAIPNKEFTVDLRNKLDNYYNPSNPNPQFPDVNLEMTKIVQSQKDNSSDSINPSTYSAKTPPSTLPLQKNNMAIHKPLTFHSTHKPNASNSVVFKTAPSTIRTNHKLSNIHW